MIGLYVIWSVVLLITGVMLILTLPPPRSRK